MTRDLLEGIKHLIHDICLADDFERVASLELRDVKAAEQALELSVGVLGAFDARRRFYALCSGDSTQSGKPL